MKVLLIIFGMLGAVVGPDVQTAFELARLVKDVLRTAPKEELAVSYGNDRVLMGNDLTQAQTSSRPEISYQFQNGTYYTLVLIDADPFSEKCPFGGELLMWLIVNIRDKVRHGEEIVTYLHPFVLPGTGLHRFTILLYKQPKKIFPTEKSDSSFDFHDRLFFSVKFFAKRYNLEDPVAGNFFTAGFQLPFLNGDFNITELLKLIQ